MNNKILYIIYLFIEFYLYLIKDFHNNINIRYIYIENSLTKIIREILKYTQYKF